MKPDSETPIWSEEFSQVFWLFWLKCIDELYNSKKMFCNYCNLWFLWILSQVLQVLYKPNGNWRLPKHHWRHSKGGTSSSSSSTNAELCTRVVFTSRSKVSWHHGYMGVSKNNGTPKSSILIGFSIINHPFWGTPIIGNAHTDIPILDWYPKQFICFILLVLVSSKTNCVFRSLMSYPMQLSILL